MKSIEIIPKTLERYIKLLATDFRTQVKNTINHGDASTINTMFDEAFKEGIREFIATIHYELKPEELEGIHYIAKMFRAGIEAQPNSVEEKRYLLKMIARHLWHIE